MQRNKVASDVPARPSSLIAQLKGVFSWKSQTAIIQEEMDWKIIHENLSEKTTAPVDQQLLILLESLKQVQSRVQSRAQSLVSMMSQLGEFANDCQDSYEQLLLGAVNAAVEIENQMQSLVENIQLTVAFRTRRKKQQKGDVPASKATTAFQKWTYPRGLRPQGTSLVHGLRVNKHCGGECCSRSISGNFDSSRRQPKQSSPRQSENTNSLLCNEYLHVPDCQQVDLLCQQHCSEHDYTPPFFVNSCCSEAATMVGATSSS